MQTQIEQVGILGVEVVLFCLNPRVFHVLDIDIQAQGVASVFNHHGQVADVKHFGELVEDPEEAGVTGVGDRNFYAAHGVTNVEEGAGLTALAVDGEGMTHRRLNTEAVEGRTKHAVVVEAVDQ